MRKKGIVVTLLLAVLCMVGLVSCGTDHKDDTDKTDQVAEYTVTFQSNGGSAVQTQTIKEGQRATKPADPTREGFEFKGWYQDQNLTSQWNFEVYTVLKNITLYAKWEAKQSVEAKYAITYVSEHGEKPEDVAEA
ncbi:MAG: InlB B-repeat-containing protein, partial [Anaeroplasmataceae bacterium]|nr:InlB B-repeat-containing protein [Anaeroplasmataceae bacterium]